jgi:hypothetical protein
VRHERGTGIIAEEVVMARNVYTAPKSCNDRFGNSKEGTMTAMTIDVGQTLPDLTLPRLDGGDLRFADLRGKKLLLFMWGSW